jgi:hypothetical protein
MVRDASSIAPLTIARRRRRVRIVSAGDGQRIASNPPRLLHRRAEFGYTDKPSLAMTGEPEAVSEYEQHVISQRSQRAWLAARRERWDEARSVIESALDGFASTVNGDPPLHNALRAISRAAEQVSRRLA